MSRQWWAVVAVTLVAAGGVLVTTRSSEGQPAGVVANPAASGRYQLQTTGASPNSTVFVLDTHTGQVWYRQTISDVQTWTDLGTPAVKGGAR
jgi:hypothetical protein